MGYGHYTYIAFPMVCFCDIPISRIQDHVAFYGSFGIGMTREWGEKNSLNPLLYMKGNNNLHSALNDVMNLVMRSTSKATDKEKSAMRHLLANTKPLSGKMRVGTDFVEKEFYQESEWRYVPEVDGVVQYLLHEHYSDHSKLEPLDAAAKEKASLTFTPNDVRYIFVPQDSDIPDIVNFIQRDLDQYPAADLKILMSRITSLDSISFDL